MDKQGLKRFLSILLTVCLVMSMSVQVFAIDLEMPSPQQDEALEEILPENKPALEEQTPEIQPEVSARPTEEEVQPTQSEDESDLDSTSLNDVLCSICGKMHAQDEVCSWSLEISATVDAGNQTVLDLTQGSITIGTDSVSGVAPDGTEVTQVNSNGYYIQGNGTSTTNSISITGGNPNITIEDVVIESPSAKVGINLSGNADVTLVVKGSNKIHLTASQGNKSAICVPSGCAITIEGTDEDTLYADGDGGNVGQTGAGIGGIYKGKTGSITINGGNITAKGSKYAAGIGGTSYDGGGENITINGGIINATGGWAASGIGTGWVDHGTTVEANVTINGGIITATGGVSASGEAAAAGIGGGACAIVNGKVTINGGTVTATAGSGTNQGADIGNGGCKKDGLTADVDVVIDGGSILAMKNGITSPENGNGAVVLATKIATKWNSGEVTVSSGETSWKCATDSQGEMIAYLTADEQALTVTDGTTVSRYTIIDNVAIRGTRLDLIQGSITIGTESISGTAPDGTTVSVCDPESYYYITGSSTTTTNSISITGGNPNITVENVVIESPSTKVGINLSGNADVTLVVKGSNKIHLTASQGNKSAICVPSGCAITIEGTDEDTLYADGDGGNVGQTGAGIGGIYKGKTGSITINGGNITAKGSKYAAGIGGTSYDGGGENITINGGIINATGGWAASGIGTGWVSHGTTVEANVTINGGIITATGGVSASGEAAAAGIGGGACAIVNGKVTINGGTVKAAAGSGSNQGADIGNGGCNRDGLTKDVDVVIDGGSILAMRNGVTSPVNSNNEDVVLNIVQSSKANAAVDVTVNGKKWSACTDEAAKLYPYTTAGEHSFELKFADKTETIVSSTERSVATLTYEFANEKRGKAEGNITINQANATNTHYVLYWGDASGKLADYAEIRSITRSGADTTYHMPKNVLIPLNATRLLVYPSLNGIEEAEFVAEFLIPDSKRAVAESPIYTFAAISDFQMTASGSGYSSDLAGNLRKALTEIQTQEPKVRLIASAGDVTDNSTAEAYTKLNSILGEFQGLPQQIYTAGNHDNMSDEGRARFLQFAGRENYYCVTDVDGYTYISLGSNVRNAGSNNGATMGTEQLEWLKAQLLKAPTDKPIFILNHQPIRNTVNGSLSGQWGWQDRNRISDEDKLLEIMNPYKNIVYISGHTHTILTGGGALYDGAGKGPSYINDAAVSYLDVEASNSTNVYSSQGLYIDVFSDKLVIRGRDFKQEKWIPTALLQLDMNWLDTSGAPKPPMPNVAGENQQVLPSTITGQSSYAYTYKDNTSAGKVMGTVTLARQSGEQFELNAPADAATVYTMTAQASLGYQFKGWAKNTAAASMLSASLDSFAVDTASETISGTYAELNGYYPTFEVLGAVDTAAPTISQLTMSGADQSLVLHTGDDGKNGFAPNVLDYDVYLASSTDTVTFGTKISTKVGESFAGTVTADGKAVTLTESTETDGTKTYAGSFTVSGITAAKDVAIVVTNGDKSNTYTLHLKPVAAMPKAVIDVTDASNGAYSATVSLQNTMAREIGFELKLSDAFQGFADSAHNVLSNGDVKDKITVSNNAFTVAQATYDAANKTLRVVLDTNGSTPAVFTDKAALATLYFKAANTVSSETLRTGFTLSAEDKNQTLTDKRFLKFGKDVFTINTPDQMAIVGYMNSLMSATVQNGVATITVKNAADSSEAATAKPDAATRRFSAPVATGTYTVELKLPNYVTREISVTGSADAVIGAVAMVAGDVNGDGNVNEADRTALIAELFKSVTAGAKGDIDGDGYVNGGDLGYLLANMGYTK